MDHDHDYFELTESHVKLLRRAHISWDSCEFGAPSIDPKRPYGNSDVYGDITEILGLTPADEDGDYTKPQTVLMDTMHRETKKALQVILASGSFQPGTYISRKYRNDWQLVEAAATQEHP